MKMFLILVALIFPTNIFGQGMNSTWLLGYNTGINEKSKFKFESANYFYNLETRKMSFQGTEATISDNQGNFLMSSNGVWIANANNDTMMNGAGLNPGSNVNSNPDGLLNPYANIFLPFPGDSNKYVLFHHTHEWDGYSYPSYDIYESIVDLTLDGGLGGVISKNNIVFSDTMNWGFGACKHANGRDWWIVASKHDSNTMFKLLYTTNGVENISTEQLNVPVAWYNVTHLDFSPDGSKFAYTVYDSTSLNSTLLLFDFNRCSGQFSNEHIIPLTNGFYLWGLSFSPSSEFVYTCSSGYIFQINVNTYSVDTVAIYDGFISGFPPNCCSTTFSSMYLAANGKIYITSGSSVKHHHEMNFPDNAGISCDVQQHSINLNMWSLRAVPNHPNYNLGALIGSPCDTLTELTELKDFNFSIYPNPSNGKFNILYLLPQNQKGKLEIFDINGKRIYEMSLPQWSTMQQVLLPTNISSGVYNCIISSEAKRTSRKIVVMKD